MAQVLKDEVRARIRNAALDILASRDWESVTVKMVADAAGLSVGNVYRYFPGKEQLLDDLLPPALLDQLENLATARLAYLTAARDASGRTDPQAQALRASLAQGLETHRRETAFLLRGAQGTKHAGFAGRIAHTLTRAFTAWALSSGSAIPEGGDRLVSILYTNMLHSLGTLLGSLPPPDASSLQALLHYHTEGMIALSQRWRNT